MTHASSDPFEYDVALSFASQDKPLADDLTRLLAEKDIQVFQDEYTPDSAWGSDVVDHLVNLYARKARYCVLLISHHYPLKTWTDEERQAAQERAFRDADEYIIPVRVDDTEIPGLPETTGLPSLHRSSIEQVAQQLEQKLAKTKPQAGPPPQSHDLRSGNVPSTKPDEE